MGSNVPVIRRSILVALARSVNAIFFLTTSSYCLLTYSSFAYQQFIKPHLVNWLTGFVVWHHLAFWLMLIVTAWTLLPELRRGRWRGIAWSYLAVSALVGIVLLVKPVLPQVENNGRGLALALVALLPPIWLAVFDHRDTRTPAPSSEDRVLKAAFGACLLVWVCQIVAIPWRQNQTGDITVGPGGFVFGMAMSLAGHAVVFAVLGLLAVGIFRVSRTAQNRGILEYWLVVVASAVAVMLVTSRIVFTAIAFGGSAAWALSMLFGVLVASVWSGIVQILRADEAEPGQSAMDWWLTPLPFHRSRRIAAAVLASLVVVEAAAISYLMTFDWDFLLQKLFVLVVWFLAFGYWYLVVTGSSRSLSARRLGAVLALPLTGFFGCIAIGEAASRRSEAFVREFVLEGYVAVDPSYRVVHDALTLSPAEQSRFYAHLRANSLIQHVNVDPIRIDFATLTPIPGPKPNVFLFVIDSLRRDYLSPYNRNVAFTPSIGRFAEDSVVFERAFTRYGGTGLAVPAIWTGGMLLHKQYVTPFDPMNTLLRLIEAEGYRKLMSMDSIVVQLMPPPPPADEVDRGLPVVEYRLCRTLEDLTAKLSAGGQDKRPVFAYTLPQDIHISHVRSEPVPEGKSYPGFFPPAAAQIERMDACFGEFIHFLKRSNRYDDSVIVVTSDHGDSLGEMLRWGHSYTMFPEVARIPLIVRVPERLREQFLADANAVSLSTDITPTLYRFLGHEPADLGSLYGRPLFASRNEPDPPRPEPQLIASSYGGVYALLHDNGSRMYIADGINGRDYAYDLNGQNPVRVGVTPTARAADQRFIRDKVDEIARLYHFVAEP